MLKFGTVPSDTAPLVSVAVRTPAATRPLTLGAFICLLSLYGCVAAVASRADDQLISLGLSNNEMSRRNAIRALPLDKLEPNERAKVESVVANVSIFRRMPVKTVECNPDLYLFLVRHPDVVVNIWEIMKVSKLQIREVGPHHFQISEASGTVADVWCLYSSASTHLIYAEGVYQGPLFAREIKGRGVLLLKTGYERQADAHYRLTCQLDSFISVEHGGMELLTKTVQPIIGKTADNNFVQTVNFVGSLSRTIETNNRGVQRLAARLEHVSPEVRNQFAEIAADMGQKTVARTADASPRSELAATPDDSPQR